MIEVDGLTKRYASTPPAHGPAVDDLSFTVQPGVVTGFLGPNGSGKSTTMRLVLGLDRPTAGSARVCGHAYRDLPAPLRTVGASLDPRAVHPGRAAGDHLLALARSHRIPRRRVDEVLDLVGLGDVAQRRAGGLSLGMAQRLGIAGALLGDPPVLLFDEPVNGLDTDGIRWIRTLMHDLAAEGRTVFVSSHLMSEMELTAQHLVVIGRGRLLAEMSVSDFIDRHSQPVTRVRTPDPDRLRSLLAAGAEANTIVIDDESDGALRVAGPDTATIGEHASAAGVVLHELSPIRSSLEDVYTRVTDASIDYRAARAEEVQPT